METSIMMHINPDFVLLSIAGLGKEKRVLLKDFVKMGLDRGKWSKVTEDTGVVIPKNQAQKKEKNFLMI